LLRCDNVLDARRSPAVRVLAPDAIHLNRRAMTALGLDRAPTARRGAQLDRCRHMVAMRGEAAAGFAAFELTDAQDLLVHELSTASDDGGVVEALVTALELACLAAGGTRLLISTRIATPASMLAPFGYEPAPWTGWLEKHVP
jgi:hypothetical protein